MREERGRARESGGAEGGEGQSWSEKPLTDFS